MQKRTLALVGMLLISTLLVACLGAYLKFEVLRPFGLFQEKNLIELPFAVMRDPAAQFALKNARQEETEPPAETPTEPVFVLDYERSAVTLHRPMKLRFPFQTIIPIVKAPPVVVTEEWFDDALFIGDSRVVGLRDYARLGKADYFCSVGLTVFDAVKIKLSDKCLMHPGSSFLIVVYKFWTAGHDQHQQHKEQQQREINPEPSR